MDQRLKKLAKLLVHYSTRVTKDDFVFIRCNDAASEWMAAVAEEAVKTGAHVETMMNSEDVAEAILKHSTPDQLREGSFIMEHIMAKATVFLTAWGGRNTRVNAGIDPEKLKFSSQGAKKWRALYSERCGNGSMRWCGTQFPTQSDAQEANMSLADYTEFVYGAGLLDKDDPVAEWKRISAEQDRWVNYLNTKKEIRIVSKDTDITVNVAGRTWINCDGQANFPDGEVFTSPVEDGVNGTISFSFPGIYNGKEIEGIRLEVKNGVVVKATAEKGEELLKALLETDEGAVRFGEVAIGTNYGIQQFTRNMLFDEKIGGTVHMAIGDSMPDAGGKNRSSIHWDMLCDMRTGGKIWADGELFYENGKFINSLLK